MAITGIKRRNLDYASAYHQSEDWKCGQDASGAQQITSLVGAAADIYTMRFPKAMYVVSAAICVTTAVVAPTIAPVVSCEKRDADGSSNAVEICAITVPTASAVGAVVEATAFAQYSIPNNKTLVLKHKTQGTGQGAAGAGILFVLLREPTAES